MNVQDASYECISEDISKWAYQESICLMKLQKKVFISMFKSLEILNISMNFDQKECRKY